MGSRVNLLAGIICIGLCTSVAAQQAAPTVTGQQAYSSSLRAEAQPTNGDLPDSPGTIAQAQAPETSKPGQAQSDAPQSLSAQAPATQSQQAEPTKPETTKSQTEKPVGTAAAGAPNATGVAASEPAGVAIAPAKQRRVRTIVIRTGAIIGAGVAIGTVVALTAGTSSKPSGAH